MQINQSVPNDQEQQIQQEPQLNDSNQQNNQIPQHTSQGGSGENLSPQDDPIDQEEGQVEEQEHQIEGPADQKVTHAHQSINKEVYINKLESYLSKVRTELSQKCKNYDELNDDNKKTKQTLKKVRFDFLSSKQQISTLNQQKSDSQKEVESLKQLNEELNQQIAVFREAGDVNIFKSKITELEKLLQIQRQELKLKSIMIDEREEIVVQTSEFSSKIDVFNLIEQYETKNKDLESRLQSIQAINLTLKRQLEQSSLQNRKLEEVNFCQEQSISSCNLKIQQLEDSLNKKEEQFLRRLKQSEESLMQLMQNQQISQNLQHQIQRKPSIKNPQQKYGIRMLTPTEQRDLILKQFIELQVKYLSTIEQLSSIRERHYHTLRQIKNILTTHISKKDYSELYKKYAKLRKCLENSLLTEQSLRNQLKQYNSSNQILNNQIPESQQQITTNLESRYRSMILEEPQNAINQVQKIMEKSSDSQHQLFTLKQQLQTKQKLMKTQKLLRQKQEQIINLQKQIESKTNINQLYNSELAFKNNQIHILRSAHQQNLNKIYELQNNTIQKSQRDKLQSLIQQSKISNQILEIKNIQAIKENNTLKNQKHLLTQLYNNLKAIYEQLAHKEPQKQKMGRSSIIEHKKPNAIIQEYHLCKECVHREQKQKQIHFLESEVQTEGLADLYFKEIKSLLTIMKKFPQKVDEITGKLDSEKATIHEVKKKFEQVTEAYAVKYRQLDEEKKCNDQWKLKQKEQIREEFQEIRDLLLNERLMTALKKAKSLIEYYQENAPEAQEEGNAEEGEGQGDEKNDGEEPIEQENQNL